MHFQCVFALFVCAANAGILPATYGPGVAFGAPALSVAAPAVAVAHAPVAVAHAPVAVASHGAVSYQNSNLIAVNPTAVVAKAAVPVAAPVAAVGVGQYGFGK